MDDMPSLATTAAAPPLSSSDTDELLDLLNNTIRSLANDAAAVRQMTDLADILEYRSRPNADVEAANDDSRRGGGGQRRHTRDQFTTQLYNLDNVITIMEGKVEELKDIINHEKDAIVEFETSLLQEAEEQERLIKSFQEHTTMKDKSLAVASPSSSSSSSTTTTTKTDTAPMAMTSATVAASSSSSSSTKRVPLLHSLMNSKTATGLSAAVTFSTLTKNCFPGSSNHLATPGMIRSGTTAKTEQYHSETDTTYQNSNSTEDFEREHNDGKDCICDGKDQKPSEMLKFEMVTQSELAEHNRHSVPFGTSRISRMDLNEALEEIEVVVHKKVELSKTTQKKALMHDKTQESYVTTNSLQRRFDYLQQRHRLSASKNLSVPHLTSGPGSPVHTSGHGNRHHNDAAATNHKTSSLSSYPVSEQELRENCAFFRHGESTARSTLSMLCNLKRLRQIPMKSKDDITYVCLFKGSSKNNGNKDIGVNYDDMQRLQPSSSLPSWSP